jgi:hypothetical protein
MAMQKALHDKLTELLKEEKDLLKNIVDWQDAAEAKEKVQKANEDLTGERDGLKDLVKTQKAEVEAKEKSLSEKDAEVKRLQAGQLTEEDKRNLDEYKKKGMTPDIEVKLNTLNDTIKTLNERLDLSEKAQIANQEALTKAKLDEAKALQRSALTTALSDAKITGEDAEIALAYISSKELAKLTKPENGGAYVENFYIIKDGSRIEAKSAKELAEHFAATHENFVRSSGNVGSGNNHSSDRRTEPNTTKGNSDSLMDLRSKGEALMDLPPK